MAISKIILNGVTQMDLTSDTVAANNLISPNTAHDAAGLPVVGEASGGSPNLQSKTNINPTTSSQTITADSGYDGLSSVQINAMPTGTEGTPTATKGTVSNHSISVTPSVTNTTGYISGSTKTGTAVTVSASELVSGSETKTANGTYDVTNLASLVVNVPSGSSKNVQVDNTNHRISGTAYTNTGASITVSTAGTYDIYWSAFRSSTSSGTNGTQWYKNDVAQGSAYTSWENSYCQTIKVTGVTLAKNDVIKIYARASSNSRYVCVANLTIVQTA